MAPMIILALQFIIIIAPQTQSARTISSSIKANCGSEIVVHSCHTAVSVSNVDGKHDFTQACRKSSAILFVPANNKFVVNSLFFQGPCQPGFIFKVDGMIAAPQNPECRKSANKWLQFAEVESFSVMGICLIEGHGENWWAGQRKLVNEQVNVWRRLDYGIKDFACVIFFVGLKDQRKLRRSKGMCNHCSKAF
ncbi:hypothetical protein SUGI_0481470 [Cryptomeria japonica]|nr:hypothetical protein SUGI_0481470 [Cryptomeria japonica]